MKRWNGWIAFAPMVVIAGAMVGCSKQASDTGASTKPAGVPVEKDPDVSAKDKTEISAAKDQAATQGNAYAKQMADKYKSQK